MVRKAAALLQMRQGLRVAGRASVLFGGLAVVMSLAGEVYTPFHMLLSAIGLFLLASGIKVMHSPTPGAMRLDTGAMFTVAAWNLIVGLISLLFDGSGGLAIVLGAAQVYWGLKGVRRHRQFVALEADRPPPALLAQIEAQVQAMSRRKVDEQSGLVEFETRGYARYGQWRAALHDQWALFVDRSAGAVMVVTPAEFEAIDGGEVLVGHKHKVGLRIAGQAYKGRLTTHALQALTAWQRAAGPVVSASRSQPLDSGAVAARPAQASSPA